MEQLSALLAKFNHFKDAEIRSLQAPSEDTVIITLAVQDDEGEDTDKVRIECVGIKDKRLLLNSVLPFLDMMSGIGLICERDLYAFAIGSCDTMLHVLNAPLYVVCEGMKIEEVAL